VPTKRSHWREKELLEVNRALININERYATAFAEILKALARDTLTLADLAKPDDSLEAKMVLGCRQRAEKILNGLGGDGHATH
jgi:hypothetical protein